MNLLRRTEVQFDRSTDPFWWGLAAVLGLVSLWLPQLLQSADHMTQVVLSEASLFFSGALIGSLRPDRPWRWGLAAFLAITLKDLSFYGRDMKVENLATSETYVFLVSNLPVYVSYSIPVIAGAYVGAYLTRGPLR